MSVKMKHGKRKTSEEDDDDNGFKAWVSHSQCFGVCLLDLNVSRVVIWKPKKLNLSSNSTQQQ